MKEQKLFKILDLLPIFLCIVVFATSIFLLRSAKESVKYAVIHVAGVPNQTVDISEISIPYTIEVEDNYHISILLENDGAAIVHSDCSDQICVKTGKITKSGMSAVCLPGRVSVTIISDDGGIDAITY